MIRYKAIAPAKDKDGNPCYNEKTCGVQFHNGVAIFDDYVVTQGNALGRNAEEIAVIMEKDFGYTVERLNMDGTPYIPEAEGEEIESEPKTRRKKNETVPA